MTVGLATREQLLAAIDRGHSVKLSAYVLDARATVTAALERAGERGIPVEVRLEGAPYRDAGHGRPLAAENRRTAADLRKHGVVVSITTPDALPLHMKAAVIDGAAYLDDRNWPSRGSDTLVVTDDSSDVAAVEAAFAGSPASGANLATEKSRALELEAETIYAAPGDGIDVESESFGASVVSRALRERASRGSRVRLIVSEQEFDRANLAEHASLARLQAAGVAVRVARETEKVCVTSDCAWVGSANATFATAAHPVIDWGVRLRTPDALATLAASFERTWRSASPAE